MPFISLLCYLVKFLLSPLSGCSNHNDGRHCPRTYTKNNVVIDIFSLAVLISQYRSCDNTLQNSFFQILSNSRAYLHITYEKTNSQDLLGPLLGKQNTQAKEVYCEPKKLSHSWCGTTTFVPVIMPSVVSVDHIKTVKLFASIEFQK